MVDYFVKADSFAEAEKIFKERHGDPITSIEELGQLITGEEEKE